ncbi:MAG: hypothetical protein LBR25_08865 [Erysipelotrichaceae bacterium]|jgi:hypothetical protein|nr:hypothetical protein [Erysipelotrichaceae bacterium]
MKKYELNPKEKLLLRVDSNPFYAREKRARVWLYCGIAAVGVGWFFNYVQKSIAAFSVLVWLCWLAIVICFLYYAYVWLTKGKDKGKIQYYFTNVRVVEADENNAITREITAGRIKKVDRETITLNTADFLINKKEDTSRKGQLKKFRTQQEVYSSETFIIKGVSKAAKIEEILGKYLQV